MEWFRNLAQMGFCFRNFPIGDLVDHGAGHPALNREEEFLAGELRALAILERDHAATIGDPEEFLRSCYPEPRRHRLLAARRSA